MKRTLSLLALLGTTSLVATGCGFEHSTSVTAPTTAGSSTAPAASGGGATGSSAPSLVGNWASNALPALPNANTCGDFQYQITNQSATAISGTFAGMCSGGVVIAGTASGTINGTAVSLTVNGTATLPGVPACPVTLSGNGTIEDNGNTLRIPFSGTTCLGPVSGVEVLRKPQAAAVSSIVEPTSVAPTANQHLAGIRTRFTVANSSHSGSVGSLVYTFEVATDEAFNNQFGIWNVTEQPNQTSLDLPKDLSYTNVYFWHSRSYDGATTSPWSRTLSFATPNPPPVAPPSNNGGADAVDMHQVISVNPNTGVADWPITTRITGLDFRSDGVRIDFSKKEGAGRWPDVIPPGWDGGIQYTIWMVVNIGGRWYTSGGVEFWHGLDRSGGSPSQFAANWYYNPQVWGPLASHQPSVGERVGFFVTAGDQRAKDVRAVTERSNVVMVSFPSDLGAFYPF